MKTKSLLLFRSIRMKLITLCLLLLLVPSLIIGMIAYQQSKNGLDQSGQVQLKNNVRFTLAMIEALDQQVKSGKISLEAAQESVKEQILSKKNAEGKRQISKRFDMGQYGYLFVYDIKGNSLASPLSEGKNDWGLKSPDGTMVIQELVKKGLNGGGYTSYIWKLPTDATKTASKITYSEQDPHWGWVVSAGTFMSDFNKGATGIYNTLVIILIVALVIGGIIIFLFSGRITKPMEAIAEHVKRIANGDMSQDIKIRSKDEVGQLAESVNDMLARLRQLIGGILQTSFSVASASEQISASTEQIASGSTTQAGNAQSIIELFKELSSAINNVAKTAEKAAELSNQTTKTAIEGGKVVAVSVEGMNKINEQMGRLEQDSNKIGEIIEVIDDIAEQTNLLALNAAIEAARAGEQGRGFAVVADEVRKLAERSGEATKQITLIIKGMQHNTKESVDSVSDGLEKSIQTGKAFDNIVNMVNETAQKVTEIATASVEQSTQTGEVMHSVESIAATSQESAAASEETAATSQSLAHLAEELNTAVSIFKVK
jgi:methyl-accepting chemotaxis protein